MVTETSGLPALRDNQFYYAWLLDPDTKSILNATALSISPGASGFDNLFKDWASRPSRTCCSAT